MNKKEEYIQQLEELKIEYLKEPNFDKEEKYLVKLKEILLFYMTYLKPKEEILQEGNKQKIFTYIEGMESINELFKYMEISSGVLGGRLDLSGFLIDIKT